MAHRTIDIENLNLEENDFVLKNLYLSIDPYVRITLQEPTSSSLKYDKKIPRPELFNPNVTVEDQLKEAYRLRNREIAFSPFAKDVADSYD